ncbi:MAG: hypothetical protein ACRDDM_07955, partial [Paraclostridium sp.]
KVVGNIDSDSFSTSGNCKIEGDYIKLENCDITNIRGKQVELISNCNIDNIEYTSNLNISKNSNVKNHVKIS